ncbi:MAG: phosphoribosylanthranilate isomerase [Betaproteobacteria bacterium]|nr:phosphoribosylanthranilate isomerase [Betaproteobacteria bacterium]
MRTRIKICGITRVEDARIAVELGADAIGLVFYAPSPRSVDLDQARAIVAAIPPFVTIVGLFVDPAQDQVESVLRRCSLGLLQFHGDETPDFCNGFGLPYIKAARVRADADLVQYLSPYHAAQGWLLDAYHEQLYGGTGESFDWKLIPRNLARPVILSGGLTPDNVGAAVRQVRPWAVDVSGGVEAAKGIKDAAKIAAFIAGVRNENV